MLKDKVLNGLLIGVLLPIILYFSVFGSVYLMGKRLDTGFNENFQLLLIGINAVVIKLLFDKKKDKIGKGVFIITFALAFVYLIIYYAD